MIVNYNLVSLTRLKSNNVLLPIGTVKTYEEWCFIVGRPINYLSWTPDKRLWDFHSYISPELTIVDNTVLRFGSSLYGTYNLNPEHPSDYDKIIITDEFFKSPDVNVHVFTPKQYQTALDNCDIQAMETYFSEYEGKPDLRMFRFTLKPNKLRTSISTIASNSWVKGKKKLIVAADYDKWLGIKSIYHSLRILTYGIQVASSGKIFDYTSTSYILEDLIKMGTQVEREDLWLAIDTKYRKLFNSLSSDFKKLAPKDLLEKDRKTRLSNLLKQYNINNEDLLNEILTIL